MITTAELAGEIFRQLSDGCGRDETATYIAVPGDETARWLVPAGRPEIGNVLASWAPHRLWSRAAWTAVRAANRLGRMKEVPGVSVLQIGATRDADWTALGWRGAESPTPVIYLGTPGRKRKAVVHLVERGSGTCRAVVKVPLTEAAKTAVRHEAEVLETLATERYEHSPRLLHVDWRRGVTTQAFVEGRPGSRGMLPEYWSLLRTLLLPGETTTLAEHAEQWAQAMPLNDDGGNAIVMETIRELLQDDLPLPACWQHGDFAPWNIKRLRDGGCSLLDWEDAQRKGLPLQDAFHFLHMQDWLFGGRPKLHAAEVWDEAVAMGVPPAPICALEAAYLVSSYLKCVREHNPERGRFVSSTLTLRRRKAA